jgi:hypothetical protein
MAWCVPAPSPLDWAWTTPVLVLDRFLVMVMDLERTQILISTLTLSMTSTVAMTSAPILPPALTPTLTLNLTLTLIPPLTLVMAVGPGADQFPVMVMDLERTLVLISTLTLSMTSTAVTSVRTLPPALTPTLTLNLILTLIPPLTLAMALVLLLVMVMVPARTLALVARPLTAQEKRLMSGPVPKPARAHSLDEERLPHAGDLVLQLRPWTARLSANDHAQRSQRAFVLVPLSGHAGVTAKQRGPRRPFWPW